MQQAQPKRGKGAPGSGHLPNCRRSHMHASFLNANLVRRSLNNPLTSSSNLGTDWTPRASLYFVWHSHPFMSNCTTPPESRAFVAIRLRQTHSAFVCCKLLKKLQTQPLVAGAYRTPSALDDIGRRRLPAMSQLTFPGQFEFATKIFYGQAHAPTRDRQISHCCYGQSFMKSSPLVVTLPAPAPFPSESTLHISCTCFPLMSVSANPQESRTRVLVTRR